MKTDQPRWSINHSRHVRNDRGGSKITSELSTSDDFLLIFQIDPRFSGIPRPALASSIGFAIYLIGVQRYLWTICSLVCRENLLVADKQVLCQSREVVAETRINAYHLLFLLSSLIGGELSFELINYYESIFENFHFIFLVRKIIDDEIIE